MPLISPDKLARTLRAPTGGAFFLFGAEDFLREQAVRQVVNAHLDPATQDFNLDQVRGADATPEALGSLINTPPLMARFRVVVLREAQSLANRARELLEAAVQSPPPGLALVISATIPPGSKARFYSTLREQCLAVEFSAVDPLDAPGWLVEHARDAYGKTVEPEAARRLVAAVGSDLGLLLAELRKLAAYVGDREPIGLDDVRAVGVAVPRQDRWEWFDLVGERRNDEALRALPVLLEAGESGVALISGLSAQLLRIGLVCADGTAALERELKPYQRWLARRVAPQARRWTLPEVDAALADLLRADRLLKSASLSDRQVMEELLLRLQALPRNASRAA